MSYDVIFWTLRLEESSVSVKWWWINTQHNSGCVMGEHVSNCILLKWLLLICVSTKLSTGREGKMTVLMFSWTNPDAFYNIYQESNAWSGQLLLICNMEMFTLLALLTKWKVMLPSYTTGIVAWVEANLCFSFKMFHLYQHITTDASVSLILCVPKGTLHWLIATLYIGSRECIMNI